MIDEDRLDLSIGLEHRFQGRLTSEAGRFVPSERNTGLDHETAVDLHVPGIQTTGCVQSVGEIPRHDASGQAIPGG